MLLVLYNQAQKNMKNNLYITLSAKTDQIGSLS